MFPSVLKNFNLFVEGKGYAGIVEELTLPKLAIKTTEYRAGGMDMPVDLDMGMNKLDASFTLSEYDQNVIDHFGLQAGKPARLSLRGAFEKDVSSKPGEKRTTAVVVQLNGMIREMDMGSWKTGDKSSLKVSVSLYHYELQFDGKQVIEIDPSNMIRKINGVDQLAEQRAALNI